MYDANGAVTTSAALSKKNVYTVKLAKMITGYSFTTATVTPVGTITSQVILVKPSDVGGLQSTSPISGNFVINCQDKFGQVFKSSPIPWNKDDA